MIKIRQKNKYRAIALVRSRFATARFLFYLQFERFWGSDFFLRLDVELATFADFGKHIFSAIVLVSSVLDTTKHKAVSYVGGVEAA